MTLSKELMDYRLIGFANVAALNCKVADGEEEQP